MLGHLRCPVGKGTGELGVVTYDVEPFGLEDIVHEGHFELRVELGGSKPSVQGANGPKNEAQPAIVCTSASHYGVKASND